MKVLGSYLNGEDKADVVFDAAVVIVVVAGAAVVDVVITPNIKFCLPASVGLPFTRKSTSGLQQIIYLPMHCKCSHLNTKWKLFLADHLTTSEDKGILVRTLIFLFCLV